MAADPALDLPATRGEPPAASRAGPRPLEALLSIGAVPPVAAGRPAGVVCPGVAAGAVAAAGPLAAGAGTAAGVGTVAGAGRVAGTGPLAAVRARGRLRAVAALLGPAFVAAVAYVDPGNFATNFSAGARFGYALAWAIVVANLMAMLVQYLSAKTGIATGRDLPELCRERFGRTASLGLWVQAELIAMATDLPEFIGAAVGLDLLFHVPMLAAGLITAIVAFGILALEQRGYRPFELAIAGLLGIVFLGFAYDLAAVGASPGGIATGLVPDLAGDKLLLVSG